MLFVLLFIFGQLILRIRYGPLALFKELKVGVVQILLFVRAGDCGRHPIGFEGIDAGLIDR